MAHNLTLSISVAIFAVAFLGYCTSNNSFQSSSCPQFTDIKITFGLWEDLPTTAYEAEYNNWTSLSNDCFNNGSYFGYRYTPPPLQTNSSSNGTCNSTGSVFFVLYDKFGYIAGVQTNMSTAALKNCSNYNYTAVQYYNYEPCTPTSSATSCTVSTVYFVDPKTICCEGRSLATYREYGSGDGLWFQNSPSAFGTEEISRFDNSTSYGGYSKTQCFPGMGMHYFNGINSWYNNNCSTIPPWVVLRDNDGCLRGCVYMVFVQNCGLPAGCAPNCESLPASAVTGVEKQSNGTPQPTCAANQQNTCNLTTIHIYTTSNAQNFTCSPSPTTTTTTPTTTTTTPTTTTTKVATTK